MDKKLLVAVLGASGMAKAHMRAVQMYENAELVAVCDIHEDRARAAADEMGVERIYTDYKQLLAEEKLDAIVLVTPDQTHREISVAALEKGIHVLCEKPMTMTLEDAQTMIDAADKSEAQMMVGQIGRYTPGFIQARELIRKGEIGELFFVETEYAHDYINVPGVDNWRLHPLRHGFLGGGCHAVDLLRWVVGNPVEVMAYANHKMLPGWPTDDCTIAIMKFPNNVLGKVFVSTGCKRDYTMRSLFYGTKGTIITDNTSTTMKLYKDGPDGCTTPEILPIEKNNHNTVGEFRDFADCILAGRPVLTDAREGARTVAACLACVESSKLGQPVKPATF